MNFLIASEGAALLLPMAAVVTSYLPNQENNKLKTLIYAQIIASLCAFTGLILLSLQQSSCGINIVPGLWQVKIDTITAVLLGTIGFIASVVAAFSERYLTGENSRLAFIRLIILMASAASMLVTSNNLIACALCWNAISFILWKLIDLRHEAKTSARTVLMHHLASDALFIAATVLVTVTCGTADMSALETARTALKAPLAMPGFNISISLCDLTALLFILSFSIKSALFPFHRWLIATLDAPTPLSGLLHAGVVNVSAIMAARLLPVLSGSQAALNLWAVVAVVSAIIGTLTMSAQFDVKRKLAFSTVGQMGFMSLQCATGAIPAAIFHLVAHGLFKCQMFLQSGSAVTEGLAKSKWEPKSSETTGNSTIDLLRIVALALVAFLTAGLIFAGKGTPTVLSVALSAVAVIAALPSTLTGLSKRLVLIAGLAGVGVMAGSLYVATSMETVMQGDASHMTGMLCGALALLLAAGFALEITKKKNLGKALYVHALNGFYIDELARANRQLDKTRSN